MTAKRADFHAIAGKCGISPILARIIRNRDVIGAEETDQYLRGSLADVPDARSLHGAERATDILLACIRAGQSIRIIGDYDVDGICSSYIFWRALKECGAKVDVRLPDRMVDGYGINERLVREALEDGIRTILTCDNGIAAFEPLTLAKESGMTVVVTDHHEIPYEMVRRKRYITPPADVIVNPKMRILHEDGTPVLTQSSEKEQYYCDFPEICGAEVAYKLSLLLLERANVDTRMSGGTAGTTEAPAAATGTAPEVHDRLHRELLTFCALATVCDVMPLQRENRIIVREGLRETARTTNVGLQALLEVNGLWDNRSITCYHAGFVIGPCLNATGRLDSAERALHLFMEQNHDRALALAQELKDLNDSRKSMTLQGVEMAETYIEEHRLVERGDKVLLVALENCHESLAGIIAGRLKERYDRPTFVLTRTEKTDDAGNIILKGSGRSIEAYDMFAQMNLCKDLFVKFGGHKMAAGLSVRECDVETLRWKLNDNCTLGEEDLVATLRIDMEMPPKFLDFDVTRQLRLMEPCGTGNEKALFVTRDITLKNMRVLGQNRNVAKFRAQDEYGTWLDIICFEEEERLREKIPSMEQLLNGRRDVTIDMVFYPEINEWNGRESMQYIIKDFRVKS